MIILIILSSIINAFGQNSHEKAIKLLKKSVMSQNGKDEIQGLEFRLTGINNYQGHYSKPFDSKPLKISGKYIFDLRNEQYFKMDTIFQGQRFWTTKTIVKKDNVYYLDSDDGRALDLSASDIPDYRNHLIDYSPNLLLLLAQKQSGSVKLTGADSLYYKVSFVDESNTTRTLFINKRTYLIDKFTKVEPHPTLRQIATETLFKGYSQLNNIQVPNNIQISNTLNKNEFDLSVSGYLVNVSANLSVFKLPEVYHLSKSKRTIFSDIGLKPIYKNVYLLSSQTVNQSLLVVEFNHFLIVLDAPGSVYDGEEAIRNLKKSFPEKPIKYVLLSHHHPSGLGSVIAFMDIGCTIVTTKGNEAYLKLIGENRINKSKELSIELIDKRKSFTDGHQQIEAIDIGEFSHHTDEYLVFYFPKEKLLYENDLGSFPENDHVTAASVRTKGLYEGIIKSNIDVKNIIQSWPYNVSQKMIPFEYLKQLVNY